MTYTELTVQKNKHYLCVLDVPERNVEGDRQLDAARHADLLLLFPGPHSHLQGHIFTPETIL